MPHEFVKQKVGSQELAKAVRQQEQLQYFTQSDIQGEVTSEYLEAWSERKFAGNEIFLSFVKNVFRTENSLSFFKYLRNPLPSAELINDMVKTSLARVFYSEDAFVKYNIRGEVVHSIPELDSKKFDESLFDNLLFRHNDIIITGLKDINTPFREFLDIDNVVAIDSRDSVIHRIAYTAKLVIDEKLVKGIMFIDNTQYIFFNDKIEPLAQVNHDLGETPADYITINAFSDEDVVRESLFSYVRGDLEEYVFLKTLQRMTEPNGVIPVTVVLDTKRNKDGQDIDGQKEGEPMTANGVNGQKARIGADVTPGQSLAQTGTVVEVKPFTNQDGTVDLDITEKLINFHHMPVEPLKYLDDRIKEIKKDLIISLVGDFVEGNESAKNEMQVSRGYKKQEDKLRNVSLEMTRIRNLSDFKFLALQHGRDNVEVDVFYGSDFFLESQEDLYKLFKDAPNPIERRNVLVKSAKNKNRFNRMKMEREVLLTHLLPYSSDEDFKNAVTRGIDDTQFKYYNQFNYWIGLFEAEFGDILIFFETLEGTNSENLILINNLIIQIITKTNTNE